MVAEALFSRGTDDWRTPFALFDVLDQEFGFVLDIAADHGNALCPNYFTENEDALIRNWIKFPCNCLHKVQGRTASNIGVFSSNPKEIERASLMVPRVSSKRCKTEAGLAEKARFSKDQSRETTLSTESQGERVETERISNRQSSETGEALTIPMDISGLGEVSAVLAPPVRILQQAEECGAGSCSTPQRSDMPRNRTLEYSASLHKVQPTENKATYQCPDCGILGFPAPVYLNCPYSLIGQFMGKCVEQQNLGVTTVALIPARTDTRYFHAYIWDREFECCRPGVSIRFLKGRVKFGSPDPMQAQNSAPFPSMIVVFQGKRYL